MQSNLDEELLMLLLGQAIPAEDRPRLKIYYKQIAKAFDESLNSIGQGIEPPLLFQV